MSELGNKIRSLRGSLSQDDFSRKIQIPARTLIKVESGQKIKLETLLKIAKGAKVSDSAVSDLLHSWIKLQLGSHAERFWIDPKTPVEMKDTESLPAKFLTLFTNLPKRHQVELLKAIERPEVLNSIATFNDAYERLKKNS